MKNSSPRSRISYSHCESSFILQVISSESLDVTLALEKGRIQPAQIYYDLPEVRSVMSLYETACGQVHEVLLHQF